MVKFVSSFTALCCLLWSTNAARQNYERGPQGNWISLKDGNQVMLADGTENLSPEKQAKLALVRRRWLDDQADAADDDGNNNANDDQAGYNNANDDQAGDAADDDGNNNGNGSGSSGFFSFFGGKKGHHITTAESMKQSEYPTADATETFYSEYSQSWRLMGFYIDCDADEDGRRRKLDEDDDDQAGCERYLLWGAYVDLDYEGRGLGEYKIWDHENNDWDTSTCGKTGGNRCVKMDCHLPETHYSLIGYYKEPNYREWMEQLFKHEGVCAWDFWDDADTYQAMQNMREKWPEKCTGVALGNGDYVYYDIEPQADARIGIAIYSDTKCTQKYKTKKNQEDIDLSEILYGSDAYDIEENIDIWNDAFDVWKYCQPCKAYDLGAEYNKNDDRRKLQDDGDADNQGMWACEDDAGYHNVNQCMKFKTKTKMIPATYKDVMMAAEQGTITSMRSGDNVYGVVWGEVLLGAHVGAFLVFAWGCFMVFRAVKIRGIIGMQQDLQIPLY